MKMDRDTELQRLEQFVEKLLLSFAELKDEKKALLTQLAQRDSLIAELEGNISSKDTERTEISLRVGKLVEQIEDWELGLDDVEESTDGNDTATDEDGRVQHNLFSGSGE